MYALLQLHIALVDAKKIHAVYELVWWAIALVDANNNVVECVGYSALGKY